MQEPFHRRPAFYLIGLLLLALLLLTIYMAQLLRSPALEEALEEARMQPSSRRALP